MTPDREDRRAVWRKPLAVWAALLVTGAISLAYALLPGLPLKPLFALSVTVLQAALLLGLLMNLAKASSLVRMAALVGAVWLGFLFLLSFADILTR